MECPLAGPHVLPSVSRRVSHKVLGPANEHRHHSWARGTRALERRARHLEVLLSPNNQLTVYFRYGTNTQFLCFVADLSKYTRPSSLKMGFTAGTGGNSAYHELQNVVINTSVGTSWDNTSGDSLWSSGSNCHPDGVPIPGSEIAFDNTYVQSNQIIDLGGLTRTVRGLSFDADIPYTLTNGTLYFSTNTEPAGRLAISQSSVNGNTNMTIAADIQISDEITVNNAALGTLFLNGGLDTQGHTAEFAGLGAIMVNGTIFGGGQVVNYHSILTLTNNTYSGGGTASEWNHAPGRQPGIGEWQRGFQRRHTAGHQRNPRHHQRRIPTGYRSRYWRHHPPDSHGTVVGQGERGPDHFEHSADPVFRRDRAGGE